MCVKYEILKEGELAKFVDHLMYKQYTGVDVMYFAMPVASNRIAGMYVLSKVYTYFIFYLSVSSPSTVFKVYSDYTLMMPVHKDDEVITLLSYEFRHLTNIYTVFTV